MAINTTETREGSTARSGNNPTGEAKAYTAPTHQDGDARSFHSPKTICGTVKADGSSCRGKRTKTGKCFSHSR